MSISNLFYRKPRLLLLTLCLILVSGLSSYLVLPRMEDPLLTERVANINTLFPGADAERVEALVTEKIEDELREVDEIKELRSISRAGVSTITIELRDEITEPDAIWSRVRDKVDGVEADLPAGALEPDFDRVDVKAYALIVALAWEHEEITPVFSILRRQAERLQDELEAINGTEKVDLFGDPEEEIQVLVQPEKLAALNLTTADLARQLQATDAKVSAGALRGERNNVLIDAGSELATLARIRSTPIHLNGPERMVQIGDIADVKKQIVEPPSSLVIVDGKRAIALGTFVRANSRIDLWSDKVQEKLDSFSAQLPDGVQLVNVFEQNTYVEDRLESLLLNLLLGGLAVVGVIFFMMGWRSALVVGSALPLCSLMLLTGMRLLEIPIHQMSVTGLILALGLLIDNAIVIVDEVTHKIYDGKTPADAVSESVRHLAIPLFGSTLTTALAFAPIALLPGPAGEFVGSIAVSVILAIASSFLMAMTVVPAFAALGVRTRTESSRQFWVSGFSHPRLTELYRATLDRIFGRPIIGVALGLALPILGFLGYSQLSEQFFPPADRNQIQIELELPAQSSVNGTVASVQAMREALLEEPEVSRVHWFVGESAPAFYYNIVPRRKSTPRYAHALVQLTTAENTRSLIRRLQDKLDRRFPNTLPLVRQLEQGPPFAAPIELRLYGPDALELRRLGQELQLTLAQTKNVIHTRAELADTLPKLELSIDEQEARLAGLDHANIAQQLNSMLEGAVGGSVLESTEELPVRVRLANTMRADLSTVASLDLVASGRKPTDTATGFTGVPLTAVANLQLQPEVDAIPHFNGRRMNEVQAYLEAGVLPAEALAEFEQRLAASGFEFPSGYSYELGGEAAKRDDAVGNLMANVGALVVIMVATLVLSFGSFRMALIIGTVASLAVGLGMGALWVAGFPFGFMAIVGTMGLVGVAINDAIVVLAAIRDDEAAKSGDVEAIREVVVRSTRHVLATSLTTMAGFAPLLLAGGAFWPPLAITIAGGVGGATILALYYVPALYRMTMCPGCEKVAAILPIRRQPEALGIPPQTHESEPAAQPQTALDAS